MAVGNDPYGWKDEERGKEKRRTQNASVGGVKNKGKGRRG